MTLLLAHLSDAHIGPVPTPRLRDLMGKRLTGWFNWRSGRHRIHNMEALERIVADIHAHQPHHIAMTGDILNIGLPGEFALARQWLATLGEPHRVSFVPGNHDAYTRGAMRHIGPTFAPWTEARGQDGQDYPYMRIVGNVALIGLSSGVPTAPFMATGRLGPGQRQRLAAMLDAAAGRGLARVVLIHHPPWRDGVKFGRDLKDAPELEAIIARHGAELILHGHNHRFETRRLRTPAGHVTTVGAPSASAVPGTPRHRAGWTLYRITQEPGGLRIHGQRRGFPAEGGDIADLGSFDASPAQGAG